MAVQASFSELEYVAKRTHQKPPRLERPRLLEEKQLTVAIFDIRRASSGLVHTVIGTPANVSNVTRAAEDPVGRLGTDRTGQGAHGA